MKRKLAKRAIEKDREATDELIRGYGQRFYAKTICEDIVSDINYWRTVSAKKKKRRKKTRVETSNGN
jgi:hypothetical protein